MNSYSQFSEDKLIAELFAKIGTENHWCFEVGAADGRWLSNTLAFREQGWDAVLAECDPEPAAKLLQEFGGVSHCVHAKVTDLDTLLARFGAPYNIDLGVIDIDGNDYWLWHDMTLYRPRVLLVEFSPYVDQPTHDPVNPIPRGGPGQTAKQPLVELGEKKGYRLTTATFCNLLFVREELTRWMDAG